MKTCKKSLSDSVWYWYKNNQRHPESVIPTEVGIQSPITNVEDKSSGWWSGPGAREQTENSGSPMKNVGDDRGDSWR
jgi:hypothetical protein